MLETLPGFRCMHPFRQPAQSCLDHWDAVLEAVVAAILPFSSSPLEVQVMALVIRKEHILQVLMAALVSPVC